MNGGGGKRAREGRNPTFPCAGFPGRFLALWRESKMSVSLNLKVLFVDVGGVLLTNGWDRDMRRLAAERFHLDYADLDERHHLTFDTYESGKLSLEEYLDRTVFFQPRAFSREDFQSFMFSQSKSFPATIEWVQALKSRYGLKVAVISNEGRELTVHRVRTFGLTDFVDFFIVSSFVHFRKPDKDIYRMALDIAQVSPEQAAYVDDRLMFVEVARSLGIRGIHHIGLESTKKALGSWGLRV
jgi:putative hydrolase of the HAD superfamily